MNILYITHYSENGGANNELLWLASEIKKRGHTVHIAIPTNGSFEKKLKQNDIPYVIIGYKRWIVRLEEKKNPAKRLRKQISISLNNYLTAKKIADYVKENLIELIHTNDSLTVVGSMAAEISNIPHVWHLREFLEEDYQRTIVYPPDYISRYFEKSWKIICISNAISRKYSPLFSGKNDIQIYDGLPIDDNILLEPKIFSKNQLKLLFLGGTSVGKGFPQLVELANLLKNQYHLNFRITVAGDCNDKESYFPLLKKYMIETTFDFVGFISNVNEQFVKNDVFLMMSKLEAFGLVTVEAMLGGAIVVGHGIGGTLEILEDKKTGFIYPENDLNAAALILRDISKGLYPLKQIREQAFEAAREKFNIKRTATQVLELYKNVKG
ncbi:glycosyltransferase family 4 protein [Negativibacillus massiliensis]|uniref:glycosyltransferase family 4 protein n=1 Tax=Negativibacillus massiliensis TaxID=1871035 RepID=UPI003AF2970C